LSEFCILFLLVRERSEGPSTTKGTVEAGRDAKISRTGQAARF